ncbi:D-alanyl-D-alanine carboxypeptidase [Microbacteriaceae bacterium SG_E_30_P1]|uniref:D-alanyl-D-alanine carboxypeptidase n=1 Tax=Antiquaquibacter oligotrophicus TaxID=2880260 RepID=A0ABT6KL88_9MICO|nr:serine hydrolase domain-containing protein [Antiquaquibacter oligotrophicus]MDH6180779.1 D-alanyl-D-alanine carboxypeptidase [Antiquaquibacter oligotrophicus]UDF13502.1 beta-lactamase family protein [Antiquaquibacter oligotrophicus]
MRRNPWIALASTLLLVASIVACTATPPPEPSATASGDALFAERMTAALLQWRASPSTGQFAYTIPGTAVAASVGDGDVVATSSGEGDPGEPLAPDAAFHIGSMTKLFTAALVMQLDEEGALALDDTIDRWFPAAPGGTEITVRMLLQHESGLAELDFDLVGHVTPQELIDQVFIEEPVFSPGTEYEYLNAGYIMLGRVAELAAETPYEELVRTRFIEPLGLTSTYLDGEATGPQAVNGFVLVCDTGEGADCLKQHGAVKPQSPSPQWPGAWSAGSMVSSAPDQTVWIRALVGGDVVDAEHLEEMLELSTNSTEFYAATYDASGVPHVQLGEGAGLATWEIPDVGICHGHAGAIPGSNGIAAYCPEADLAIVILNAIEPAGLTPGYPGLTPLTAGVLWALGG